MPELPEVETIVRSCRPRLVGRRILDFSSTWPKGVLPSRTHVRRALQQRTIARLTRRGKFIVFDLDDQAHLLVHLRMSGRFEWADETPTPPRHVRASWQLDDGRRLLFCDARKFGRILHTRDLASVLGNLGPEPLSRGFTAKKLADLVTGRRRQLKPLLLDQTFIAGLGNIYSDEALFYAGLHPLTSTDTLRPDDIARLHVAIRKVLRLAIRNHGTSLDWIYPGGWMQCKLAVYQRTGAPCRACGTPIVAFRVAQRGTHICPDCQPARQNGRTPAHARRT